MTANAAGSHATSIIDAARSAQRFHHSQHAALLRKRPVRQSPLSSDAIRTLNRDLRMLIATNGTLTRILSIVAGEEIDVEIVNQEIHQTAPKMLESEQLPTGRILRRDVLLKGRNSGSPFVAAESLIAIDHLPPEIVTSLITTNNPIGELMVGGCLEMFKETPQVWMGESPGWFGSEGNQQRKAVGRRYRQLMGGEPILIITEYFPLDVFQN